MPRYTLYRDQDCQKGVVQMHDILDPRARSSGNPRMNKGAWAFQRPVHRAFRQELGNVTGSFGGSRVPHAKLNADGDCG